jgi:hypothetical protein
MTSLRMRFLQNVLRTRRRYYRGKSNLNMTRFKAMSMDEQVKTIEQSAQEALRVREEIRGEETTEAQRRGLLLLEGA